MATSKTSGFCGSTPPPAAAAASDEDDAEEDEEDEEEDEDVEALTHDRIRHFCFACPTEPALECLDDHMPSIHFPNTTLPSSQFVAAVDEELRAVGVPPRVRHAQRVRFVVLQLKVLIFSFSP